MISRYEFKNIGKEEAMKLANKSIGNTNTDKFQKVVGVDFSYGTFLSDLKYYYGIKKVKRKAIFEYMSQEEMKKYVEEIDCKKTENTNEKLSEKYNSNEKEVYAFNLSSKNSKVQFSVSDEVLEEFRKKHPASKGKKDQLILISVAIKYFLDHEDNIDIKIML